MIQGRNVTVWAILIQGIKNLLIVESQIIQILRPLPYYGSDPELKVDLITIAAYGEVIVNV